FLDNRQYIILCITKQQTKVLSELSYIEIGIAFKKVYGITNKWKVSAYSHRLQKTDAYQNLFEDLFGCIKRNIGKPFNFYHIYEKGLECVIADQYKGQVLEEVLEILSKIQFCNEIGAADTCQNKSELARSIQAKKQAEKRRKNKQPLLSSSTSVAKKEKAMALTRKMQLKSL
ncbi:8448_t:CDS:2, partial [Funneliformis geosporum]